MSDYDFAGSDDEPPHKNRITDVMSRVGGDLNAVLQPTNAKRWIEAAHACKCCKSVKECEGWISQNEEGAGQDAPEFCPNAKLMQRFKPKEA